MSEPSAKYKVIIIAGPNSGVEVIDLLIQCNCFKILTKTECAMQHINSLRYLGEREGSRMGVNPAYRL